MMPGNSMETPLIRRRPTTAHKRPRTPSTIPTVACNRYSRPSGVRRSIHSSASARVMSVSGLPRRVSRRSTPFSPRHSTASVFRRSTWLLRAFPAPPFFEGAGFSDARKTPVVLHLGRGLHYGYVPVRLVGDLDQIRVYPPQPQAMGLVEEARKKDILLPLPSYHEFVSQATPYFGF